MACAEEDDCYEKLAKKKEEWDRRAVEDPFISKGVPVGLNSNRKRK